MLRVSASIKCFTAVLFLLASLNTSLASEGKEGDLPGRVAAHIVLHASSGSAFNGHVSIQGMLADSIIIPLRQAGRLFLIEGKADGETGFFVFDTGASGLVLNRTYFRDHVTGGSENSSGITGSVGKVDKVTVDRLDIADLHYTSLPAGMTNLGHIENRRGVKILGLIGFQLLKDFEIVFDPQQNLLQLYRIDKVGNRSGGKNSLFRAEYTQKIDFSGNIIFMKGTIGHKSIRFCLDTGAETNVIDNHMPKEVIQTLSLTRRSSLKGAGSNTHEVLFGIMNDFVLGNRALTGMETILANLDDLEAAYGAKTEGMLGYSFLSRGVFCFNFVKKEIGIRFYKDRQQ